MASADSGESKPAGEEGAAANPEHINLKVEYTSLLSCYWPSKNSTFLLAR